MYRIGWFSTGRGKGSRDLLTAVQDSIRKGDIKAEIEFVFSSREAGEAEGSDQFQELVRSYGIPLVCFSSKKFKPEMRRQSVAQWRLEYDREVIKRLGGFSPDLCVLAGYMLIVGDEMCYRYDMINLHPAVPGGPTGTWQEVIWELIGSGADSTGAMMHLVTPELDRGPVVTYHRFSIKGEPFDRHWKEAGGTTVEEMQKGQGEDSPLFKVIRQHGLAREFPLIIATIKAFSDGKVRVEGGRVVDSTGKAINGYDLTPDIDMLVRGN
jgi:phosphoribosylglycinamide formyltransferase-1